MVPYLVTSRSVSPVDWNDAGVALFFDDVDRHFVRWIERTVVSRLLFGFS